MLVKKNRIAVLFTIRKKFVVRPGFEPRQTVPKTVVLPLYYRTIISHIVVLKWNANLRLFFIAASPKSKNFQIFSKAYLIR